MIAYYVPYKFDKYVALEFSLEIELSVKSSDSVSSY